MINIRKLRLAIKGANAEQVTEILRTSRGQNLRLTKGWTPLHAAVKRGSKEVVAAILDLGADVNATTEMHETALDLAQRFGHERIAALLLKKGARPGAALNLHAAAASGDLKTVRKHVASGANMDALVDGELPLCIALDRRHWDIANFLINRKCDVTVAQQWGVTPLHFAASSGAPEVLLTKLIKAGALIDAPDSCMRTPLCYAAQSGQFHAVNYLIDHGADVTWGRETSNAPVYCALYKGHIELASHLIDRGAKSTLHQAVQCDHLARAPQRLNAGADPNEERDPIRGESPLEMAIWLDSTEMAALLLEFGADPNQQDRAVQGDHGMLGGNTSLHEAVYKGSAKMVKVLLAHGADPDIPNADGLTPMELARRKDRTHLANLMDAHLDKKLSIDASQTGIEPLYTIQKVAELLSVDDSFILELIKNAKDHLPKARRENPSHTRRQCSTLSGQTDEVKRSTQRSADELCCSAFAAENQTHSASKNCQ